MQAGHLRGYLRSSVTPLPRHPRLCGRNWYYQAGSSENTTGYAHTHVSRKNVPMHRFILDAPKDLVVDHINGDGLDNRRENLRLATLSQNRHNQKKRGASEFKGVFKRRDRYEAAIRVDGKYKSLGMFATAEEAAAVYNDAVKDRAGEFARLNEV